MRKTIFKQFAIFAILILTVIPASVFAQSVNCGDNLTSNTTLTADLDCSTSGTALTIGQNGITLDGAGFTITVNGNNTAIVVNGRSNITITNATVESSVPGQGKGLNIINSGNSTITNNNFSGLTHAITGGGNPNTVFSGNNLSGASSHAIYFTQHASNSGMVIDNNNIQNSAATAIGFYGGYNTPASINGNNLTGSAHGMYLHSIHQSPFTLSPPGSSGPNSNTFANHTESVITLSGSRYITIDGWDFTTLFDSSVDRSTKVGLNIYNSSNCTISNNNLSGFSHAIKGGGNPNTSFTGNNLSGASSHVDFPNFAGQ
ncbi:MAG: hypothetical protein HN729_09565 [Candidatus Marinimicrobia bacterium]|jgi:parallel beta-helix repeat protein|nr:hypothetical protein [Candidatus Neomarinimicrobiota bacterium]MBT3635243.1 hypothetical protein [Candidatus Neomarinimicrobiota bacterium]MBT3683995.1 hypothetical protein [Candidatus Neomarinimicrobiota bacterium]MBT3760929.1 hypothetical protein [Candidatus Neomarinimicrobiota bacterium]MBT3896995.1 hypothetical protein [Candidatus Neomarinimicrobiota bacterium]